MTGMALWNNGNDTPLTEEEVTTTVEPVRTDGQAEADSAPDFNEIDTDESSQLVGLSPRLLAPFTAERDQYAPWWAAMASADYEKRIDDQVSSSGTAAAREQAGIQGHGSMQYSESMEPVIRDGAAYGNDYFKVGRTDIQDGAGQYMVPIADNWANAVAQRSATTAARAANADSQYAAFLGGN